ncbi:acetolactate synthase large subunit [Bradyrhizobium sp. 14AA]
MPNGAQALLQTLVNAGIKVCFTNPGTSEMHFVAALDAAPGMRAVLCLFEGVATGAADGYARMTRKPAATLLHLGCGLGNGLANLHNARKGKVPVVNIVGDHATYHVQYDAQLQSDIETVARNVSPVFVRTSKTTGELCRDAVDAVCAAMGPPGQVATLVLPADVSWGEGGVTESPRPIANAHPADDAAVRAIAAVIRSGSRTAILLGGAALQEEALLMAARIAAHSNVTLFAETFPTRMQRGAGLPTVERIPYVAELAAAQLKAFDKLVLVDAKAPVSFFAYPDKPSYLVPSTCEVHVLSRSEQDAGASLAKLAGALGAEGTPPMLAPDTRPGRPQGASLTAENVCEAVGHLLPGRAIIIDESITSGATLLKHTAGCPKHDLLTLSGGAIGQALPNAVGAAIACPDRPVLALVGDGTSMYTIQALWTIVREKLDVTTVIFNNASYAVLGFELGRVGALGAGPKARAQLDLQEPALSFSKLAEGMGMSAARCTTVADFVKELERAFATPGPHLIEAIVPSALGHDPRRGQLEA